MFFRDKSVVIGEILLTKGPENARRMRCILPQPAKPQGLRFKAVKFARPERHKAVGV